MFKELAPYLRQRAVLLTVTHIEEDQIRVNVIPQKLNDGENVALMTPLTVTGTAEELDLDLPATLVDFVSALPAIENTWTGRRRRWMRLRRPRRLKPVPKTKSPAKKEPPKQEAAAVETPKTAQAVKTELPKTASLFDAPESAPSAATADTDEEEELLGAVEEDDQIDEDADLDEAA
jgi:PRTRC genetic system protein E